MKQKSGLTWLRHVPAARWLAGYRVDWLAGDAVAGCTLAAYAIPVSLAYAGLAGLPPQAGIYGYLLGGLGYALLGSSRQLAIGPTSAISLMIADTVATMAYGDAHRYAQIASLAACMVAMLCMMAWLLRLSVLVRLISDSILVGFKAGAGLTIAMTQMPSLLGVAGGGHNFFDRAVLLVGQLGQIHYLVFALGLVAILLLVLGDRLLPAKPVGLAVVALSILVASAFGFPDLGVPTTGEVPAGLPSLEVPSLRLRDVEGIVPLAAGCLLLAYIESVSAARTFAASQRQGRRADSARPDFCLLYAGAVPAVSHGPAGNSAEGGACRRRADRSVRIGRFSGDASHVAHQPDGFLRGCDRPRRRAAPRDPARNTARCAGIHTDAVGARVPPARRVPGSHTRDEQLFRSRPPP